MGVNNRYIPADTRRKIYVEAGHRCAIHTCREIEIVAHHIVPWSETNKHEYENLIALCPTCHARADRGEIDKKALYIYKANLRYTHDRFSQFEVDMLFEVYGLEEGHGVMFPGYLMMLVKRLLDSGYVQRTETDEWMSFGGMKANPDYLVITPAGREFVDSLGLEHDDR